MNKRRMMLKVIGLFVVVFLFAGCGSLSKSVINNDVQDVQNRIKAGEDINQADKTGWRPIHWAVYYQNYAMAKYLLEKGADPNVQVASYYGNIIEGGTPLWIAAYYGWADMTELLLKHGADKNIANIRNETPRSVAKKYISNPAHAEVFRLLDKGVAADAKPPEKAGALQPK